MRNSCSASEAEVLMVSPASRIADIASRDTLGCWDMSVNSASQINCRGYLGSDTDKLLVVAMHGWLKRTHFEASVIE